MLDRQFLKSNRVANPLSNVLYRRNLNYNARLQMLSAAQSPSQVLHATMYRKTCMLTQHKNTAGVKCVSI